MFKALVAALFFGSTAVVLAGCSRQLAQTERTSENSQTETLASPSPNPLSLTALKAQTYQGSEVVIESELPATATYRQYLTSYQSDGLKINALLTVPKGDVPEGGWPAIFF